MLRNSAVAFLAFFGLTWVAVRQKSAGQSKNHSNNPKEQPDTDNPPGKDGIRQ